MKPDPSTVHPELQPIARRLPELNFSLKSMWFWRLADFAMGMPKSFSDIRVESVHIPRPDPLTLIRLRVYRPKNAAADAPGMIWLHGGGYIIGKPEQDDSLCAQYARELGMVVISVDYRRAPEDPFPAGLEDAYTALRWFAKHAGRYGVDPRRIGIGGSSAGGGLAAALAQYAFDRKVVRPAFQLLIYPMLDDRTTLRADLTQRAYYAWTPESNYIGWKAYLGVEPGAETVPQQAVPARRTELSGLPPAWIGVGSLDLFHDEDVAYAQRLGECGVPCELVVVPGAFHGFDVMGMKVPVVQEFFKSQIDTLRRYLAEVK